jgi:hypothetical protein
MPEASGETPWRREAPPGLRRPGLRRPLGVRRNGIDTADFGFAVIGVLWGSGDISGGRVCSAIAEPPRGTQDCNIELGDGWG